MQIHRVKTVGGLVAVAVAAGTVFTGAIASAEPVAAPALSAQASEHKAQLLEFATNDNRGSFYTLDQDEAERAQRDHGFKPKSDSAGITMFDEQVDGSIPVYRLRQKDAFQSYLLSVNQDEIDGLGDRFVNEGVIGYVLAEQQAGTQPLERYSNNSDWRVARKGRVDLLVAGFKDDGPLGYVPLG